MYDLIPQKDNGSWEPEYIPKKEKSFLSRKMAACMIAMSLVISSAVGFGGGYLAASLNQEPQPIAQAASASSALVNTALFGSTGLSVAQIAQMNEDTVVEITTETVQTNQMLRQVIQSGAGSGVIVSNDGYIATNNHVIENASKITVRLHNGQSYEANLVGTDAKTDIAVIKIKETNLKAATIGSSASLQVGEMAVAIGNPLGQLGGTVTDGIISALDRQITIDDTTMTLLQTNAAINPGNSGGGLFNAKGELIGIVNAKSSGEGIEGLGFAIPIDTAKEIIQQLTQYGYVKGRVDLGMSLVDISNIQMAWIYRVGAIGVYVQKVEDGSNAQKAGFQPGDRIIAVDGTEVYSSSTLKQKLDGYRVGDNVTFTVSRNGQTAQIRMQLAEYTPSK